MKIPDFVNRLSHIPVSFLELYQLPHPSMHVTVRVIVSGTTSVFRVLSKRSVISRIVNRKMSVKTSPYGSWASPISSKLVSESSVGFQEVHVDNHPDNTGR